MRIPGSFRLALVHLSVIFCIGAVLYSCNSKKPVKSKVVHFVSPAGTKVFSVDVPGKNQPFTLGQKVTFEVKAKNNEKADSVMIYNNGKPIHMESENPSAFVVPAATRKTGLQDFRIRIYYQDSLSQNLSVTLRILSDLEPKALGYKLLRTIPHNETYFTQGLFYKDGFLFEGTGQKGYSRLVKIDASNGHVLKEQFLEPEYFGEGITYLNGEIYQLTWLSRKGFIYDWQTFDPVREFHLQSQEGWGLTTDGVDLIVSDGSARLYFYDPVQFAKTSELQVSNHKGNVNMLNELEYHDGSVWANIYTTPYIIKIDAGTGAVLGRLDLSDLYPDNIPRDGNHVLNGIAYNPRSDTYFVTGKLWPVIYEISISE